MTLLGYRVFPDFKRLPRQNVVRARRRLRALAANYRDGRVSLRQVDASVQAWIGHACNADTLGLRTSVFDKLCFSRGDGA